MRYVHIPAWLPLAHFSLYPETQIGEWGRALSTFHKLSLPVPLTLLIPVQTFKDIAEENDLEVKLQRLSLLQSENPQSWVKEVRSIFHHLKIPRDLAKDLLRTCESLIGDSLVKIQVSPINDLLRHQRLFHECVSGDANIFDSILELWAEGYLRTQNLFPGAITIQQQLQPSSSGIALSKDPETGLKTQAVIFSTWGAQPSEPLLSQADIFKVDLRTLNVVFAQTADKHVYYERQPEALRPTTLDADRQHQPSLTLREVSRLTQYIHTLKMHSLDHLVLNWELVNGTFYITQVQPLEDHNQASNSSKKAAIITGQTVIPGLVEGITLIGIPTVPPHALPVAAILIVKQFTPQLSLYIPHISAVISEQPLPAFAHQILHRHHIPSIAGAKHATTHLKNGQSLVLDATKGSVFVRSSAPQPTMAPTLTKVWASASNPDVATTSLTTNVDGIFFKGERLFAQLGEHPVHVVRHGKKPELLKQLAQALEKYKPTHDYPLVYKPQDILTSDLLELSQARSFEQSEPNPYLGYRGALRTSHNFEVFDTELEVLSRLISDGHRNLGLIIPLTRTPAELRLMLSHIRHLNQPSLSKLQLWWHICTPENIWHLHRYLTPQLTGIVLSIKDLHALAHGIDPTHPDVYARYPLNLQLIREMIGLALSGAPHHKIMIQLDSEQRDLVQLAAELKIAGVIVKPAHTARARQVVLDIEHQQWK